jgi:hypothetical protein
MQRTLEQQASPAAQPPLDTRLQTYRIVDLLDLVQEGRLRVAPFKRAWRWSPDDVVALFDSLHRGYPVGALVFWKRSGEDALWVLDGQQRITALAGALLPAQEEALQPTFDLYFDFERATFTWSAGHSPVPKTWLPMRLIADTRARLRWLHAHWGQGAPRDALARAEALSTSLRDYQIPAYVVDTDDESVIRHVLHRLLTTGRPPSQAEVFDVLHGAHGQKSPGDLHEVAERLVDTGFGELSTDLILQSLRLILRQDGVSERELHLLSSTVTSGALARTENALRRVIALFREDARIPYVQLVPYQMSVAALAPFFDRHPEASPRSRQLLARWVWRSAVIGVHGGDIAYGHAPLRQAPSEAAAVEVLLAALPKRPRMSPELGRFDLRSARSKLETLALLALRPIHFVTNQPVTISTLFGASAPHPGLPTLLQVPAGSSADFRQRARTLANRIAHPHIPAHALRELLGNEVPDELLESHGISRTAWETLREGDAKTFLALRGERLAAHTAKFLEARAAWEQSDRPALKALVVSDED